MKLIKQLQECSTFDEANPILTKLGAGPAVKKLVETALILAASKDAQQRNHAYSFMESAIKELEDDIKKPEDKKLEEEVLDNNNNGPREGGSEQSTENTEPFSGPARDSTNGEKPMQDLEDTMNQWSETDHGTIVPGIPPKKMDKPMPNSVADQIRYTVQEAMKDFTRKVIAPEFQRIRNTIKEVERNNGSMKLDINSVRENATARIRETSSEVASQLSNQIVPSAQKPPSKKKFELEVSRHEIEQIDKMFSKSSDSIYS